MSALRLLPHQPIQLYKISPTTDEKKDGYTAWATTAFHKRLGVCDFIASDYCHPIKKGEDYINFQFKAAYGDDLFQNYFNAIANSTTTSTSANHLVDSGANFIADGVQLDYIVLNNADITSTTVANVDSGTSLTLNEDIFTSGETYSIIPIAATGNFRFNYTDLTYEVLTAGSGSTIEVAGMLTVGSWYRAYINITDITAGSIQVKFGTTVAATLTSVGTHVVYGQCAGVTDFTLTASSTFVGSIKADTINVNLLETSYTVALFDLDNVFVEAFLWTETSNSLTIGNIFVNNSTSGLSAPCGSYVLAVYEGNVVPCQGQMITTGNFSSSLGWSTDPGITITGGAAEFSAVSDGNNLSNNLSCDIVAGKSYTLTWDIALLGGIKSGEYYITTAEGNLNPPFPYNAGTDSVGTKTLTFTAAADSGFLAFSAANGGTTFKLDNVSLVCNNPEIDILDADSASECYCICNTVSCSPKIEYGSTRPTYGQYFEDGVLMSVRVPGRLRNQSPVDVELNAFNSTQLEMVQPYVKQQYNEELATTLMPDYAHRNLGVALSHPILYIDGVAYARTGAYTPNHKDETELSEVIVQVAKKKQNYLENNY